MEVMADRRRDSGSLRTPPPRHFTAAPPIVHSSVAEEEVKVSRIQLPLPIKVVIPLWKQAVCFCVVNYEKSIPQCQGYRPYNIEWYIIDDKVEDAPTDSQKEAFLLKPHLSLPFCHSRVQFGSFAFNSDLYLLGGSTFPNSRRLRDVVGLKQYIKPCLSFPRMRLPRRSPAVIVKGNQVYVLGGSLSKKYPWGELYHVELEKWEPLPDPPEEIHSYSDLVGYALLGDGILLAFYDSKQERSGSYTFSIQTRTWSSVASLPPHFNWPKSFKETPCVDGVLYSCDCQGVYATGYDVCVGEKFTVKVSGLELDDVSRKSREVSSSHLVHLRDMEFCLLIVYQASSGGLQADYTRFLIEKSGSSISFAAVKLSSGTCTFQGDEFQHCLTICARFWRSFKPDK